MFVLTLVLNLDYNDFIIAIEGADGIGITPDLENVMATNRDCTTSNAGEEIFDYAFGF